MTTDLVDKERFRQLKTPWEPGLNLRQGYKGNSDQAMATLGQVIVYSISLHANCKMLSYIFNLADANGWVHGTFLTIFTTFFYMHQVMSEWNFRAAIILIQISLLLNELVFVCLFVCKCQHRTEQGVFPELSFSALSNTLPSHSHWLGLHSLLPTPQEACEWEENKHHHHNKLTGPVFAETISSSEPQLELSRVWEECSKPRKDLHLTPCLLSLASPIILLPLTTSEQEFGCSRLIITCWRWERTALFSR